jgi:DNA-binding transcriptional MocR family regulator
LHLFASAILRHFPDGTRLSRPEGGFVLWVEMPPGVDTLRLQSEALRQHINTAPGALFSVKDRFRNCLRMNCGLPWSDTIAAAVRTLGELAQRQL